MQKFLSVLVCGVVVLGVAWGCPDGISPCKCTDTIPGVTIDCTAASSNSQIQKVFSGDWPNNHFDFFQVVPLTGTAKMDAIPDNLFSDKTFEHCWIGDSAIESIGEKAFAGMEDTLLEILLGDTQKLTSFPCGSLNDFNMLYKVQVIGSSISQISSFGAVPQLAEINFPNSGIASIDADSFNDLPRLTHVDLSHSNLEKIEDSWFSSTSSVEWALYLTDNTISEVSPGAFSGTLPSALYLGNNKLATLPEATFSPLLKHMSTEDGGMHGHLNVKGNPLVCDCAIQWLATDASFLPIVSGAVCTNDEVSGVDIADLPGDFFADC